MENRNEESIHRFQGDEQTMRVNWIKWIREGKKIFHGKAIEHTQQERLDLCDASNVGNMSGSMGLWNINMPRIFRSIGSGGNSALFLIRHNFRWLLLFSQKIKRTARTHLMYNYSIMKVAIFRRSAAARRRWIIFFIKDAPFPIYSSYATGSFESNIKHNPKNVSLHMFEGSQFHSGVTVAIAKCSKHHFPFIVTSQLETYVYSGQRWQKRRGNSRRKRMGGHEPLL